MIDRYYYIAAITLVPLNAQTLIFSEGNVERHACIHIYTDYNSLQWRDCHFSFRWGCGSGTVVAIHTNCWCMNL